MVREGSAVSRDGQRIDYGAGVRPMRQRRVSVDEQLRRQYQRIRALPADEKLIRLPIVLPERPR
jgi:hypothetical protein